MLPSLKVVIEVSTKGATAAVEKFKGKLEKLRPVVKRISASLKKFGSSLQKMARPAAVAAGAISGALFLAARSMDDVAKTADKLGLTTDALQELRVAADLAGVGTATFDMAIQRFGRRVAEARRGTGEAKDALKELGISFTDADGRMKGVDELLGEVADGMSQMSDQTDMNRVAMKLFDSEGVALVNMLRGGAAGLDAYRAKAVELGLVLDEGLLRNAEKAMDAFSLLKQSMRVGISSVLGSLLPILEGVSNAFVKLFAVIHKSEFIRTTLAGMAVAVVGLTGALLAAKVAAILFSHALLATGIGAIVVGIGLAIGALIRLAERVGGMGELWRILKNITLETWDRIGHAVSAFVERFYLFNAKIKLIWAKTIQYLAEKWASFVGMAGEGINAFSDLIGQGEVIDVDGINSWAGGFEEQVKKVEGSIGNLEDRIKVLDETAAAPIESIAELFKNVKEEVKDAKVEIAGVPATAATAAGGAAAALAPLQEKLESISGTMKTNLTSGFMSMVDGTKSVADAFRDMARSIIAKLYEVLVVQRLVGDWNAQKGTGTGIVGALMRGLGGLSFAGGGFTGSGPRVGGVDGKGGFPAILHPNETVVDHTKGGGGAGVTVNQTINVSTGVQQTVRAEVMGLMPQIADASKMAVHDAVRRGGSYGSVFS